MKISHLPMLLFSFFLLSENTFCQTSEGVDVAVKVFLQGALIDVPAGENLMRDDLRTKNMLPVTEPYTGMSRYENIGPGGAEAILKPAVFSTSGSDAIVDWVFLELRASNAPEIIMATRSVLLQRDGDVVDMDGESPVFFEEVEPGEYFVAVRHRNHLGIMTEVPVLLNGIPANIDFSDPAFDTYGEYSQAQIGDLMAMRAGDANNDGRFTMQGPSTDASYMFGQLLSDENNLSYNVNHITEGYHNADIDLDGNIIYAGTGSDRGKMFSHIWGAAFQLYGSQSLPSGLFIENLP